MLDQSNTDLDHSKQNLSVCFQELNTIFMQTLMKKYRIILYGTKYSLL